MVNFTAGFALASLFCIADGKGHTVPFKVRVRNLTYMQPFSPPIIVAHTKDVALFKEGFPASDAIKLMAEDGNNSALVALTESKDVAPYICGVVMADGPLLPGKTWRGQLDVDDDICHDPVYSVVSMLVNTNDAFVGIDSYDLKLRGSSKDFPPAFDAGTEVNNELCSSMPGPACPPDSHNIQNAPGEGFIHVHRGFHGIGDLKESTYDWRNPVAEVFITAK